MKLSSILQKSGLKYVTKGWVGSDISSIIGVNSYKTVYDLFLEKVGRKEADDLSENEAVQRGNRSEAPLRDLINALHPEYQFYDPGITFQRKDKPWMLANLDGISKDGKIGLEIKTAKVRTMEDWTDSIPQSYYAQIMWYMAVTGLEKFIMWAYVERISFDDGEPTMYLKKFEIIRNNEEIEYLEKEAEKFWEKVKAKEYGEFSLNIGI
jgi:putative phage-type endonuclease